MYPSDLHKCYSGGMNIMVSFLAHFSILLGTYHVRHLPMLQSLHSICSLLLGKLGEKILYYGSYIVAMCSFPVCLLPSKKVVFCYSMALMECHINHNKLHQ